MSANLMLSEKRMVQISRNIDGQGVYWTDNICDEIPVAYRFNDLPPMTVMECFQKVNAKYPSMIALKTKRKGITLTWTKTQYYDAAAQFAKALMSLNIKEKSGINIIGFNSPEWVISWLGGVFGNYISAGVYSTNTAEVCKSIALNSDANVIIAENESYILRYEQCYDELKNLIKCIVLWDGTVPQTCKFPVFTFNEFLEKGRHYI
jgi:long-subunit acyl-CoA synthetase (AMP-forming)